MRLEQRNHIINEVILLSGGKYSMEDVARELDAYLEEEEKDCAGRARRKRKCKCNA